jgi:hypothetical protein
MEFEESAGGEAGAVAVESVLAGAVDCCLEQATMARALRQTKRTLRFIYIHLTVGLSPRLPKRHREGHNVPSQAAFHALQF